MPATIAIGAVLSQVQDGQERAIANAGRSLSKNEMNYCAYRKELLAVVYFTRHQAVSPVLSLSAAHRQLQRELAAKDSRASRPECPMAGTAGRVFVHRAAQKRHQ